jgi:predicted RNA-binding Zn ribbon-like protein
MTVHSDRSQADAFLFIGETLAIDLVNTEIVDRGRARDLLVTPDDLIGWWCAVAARYPVAWGDAGDLKYDLGDPQALVSTRELRAALRGIFGAVVDKRHVDETDLGVLNRHLRIGFQTIAVAPDGALRPVVGSHGAGPDRALLAVANDAFALLTSSNQSRLHRCANDRCVLLFYDTTRSATRRWCSVACMNRARSIRRHRERKRTMATNRSRNLARVTG